jgi:cytidine deaminase
MQLMNYAVKQALTSNCRFRVGAVIAAGNRILAGASNVRRNSPQVDFRHATFHAEEAALRRAHRTRGAIIYVARVNSSGSSLLARPCARCQEALHRANIVKAYYTTGTSEIGSITL